MAAMRGGPRLAVGSAAWIAEERSSARQVLAQEVDDFSFSARNEMEWLNEHMAEVFSENQMNVAELFKTPGKLRGKTPRTVKKTNAGEARVPLSNIFSTTPKGAPNPFAISNLNLNQAQQPRIKIAEDAPAASTPKTSSPSKNIAPPRQQPEPAPVSVVDSGYHGSQSQDMVDLDMLPDTAMHTAAATDLTVSPTRTVAAPLTQASPTRASMEETFQSAKEDQTRYVTANVTAKQAPQAPDVDEPALVLAKQRSPAKTAAPSSPIKSYTPKTSPIKTSPIKPSPAKAPVHATAPLQAAVEPEDVDEDIRSPSDGSSPIRPIVRKSSLNFASLPAREPLTSNKSLGARVSRVSHLDHTRTSYYHRQTGGKSLSANVGTDVNDETETEDNEDDGDAMDIDHDQAIRKEQVSSKVAIAAHNKTYTQRLQDQISMLGKSQPSGPRPSKSLANLLPAQQTSVSQQPQQPHSQPAPEPKSSPLKQKLSVPAPGAFPEDDEEDWIAPPTAQPAQSVAHPRPDLTKSHSTDVMEGVHGKETIGGSEFVLPKSRPTSPKKGPAVPERTTSASGHSKSVSVPALPTTESTTPKKAISVSNPTLNPVAEDAMLDSLPKSPSRSIRESPLKHVKNKLSSILKTSKGLLASSAALSAEGKSSLLSPSTTRLGFHPGPSVESLRSLRPNELVYPDLPQRTATPPPPGSPTRNNGRRTRASVEREKKEAKEREKDFKEREKEQKEAKRLAEQMDKLEKEREKEREKARVFSKERERIAAMEKQVAEVKDPQKPPHAEVATPAPPKSPLKTTRTSPRKTKAQKEAEEKAAAAAAAESKPVDDDMDMADASVMPPPSIPRPTTTPAAARGQALRRPTKPTQEIPSKAKAAPTVIRVKPTSAQQSQFHPSNSVLGSTLQDTLGPQQQEPRRQLTSKPSHSSLQTKPSLQSLKSSVGSSGRPKALELAAKRKEQEEREAQRKKEAKQEMERKRAAIQEEERRQEQQRRLEMERQKEEERRIAEKAAMAKKDAQRQAAIERAKQTRAPPPAVRSQPNGPSDYSLADKGPSRPPSRLGSMIPQDSARPVNAVLSHTSKGGPKRALQTETNEEARPPMQRNGLSYQTKEAKRMRMSEEFDDDIDMADTQPSIIKGPPVRPSGGFKKDLPTKSMFNNGYTAAPQGVSRDLFKTTVTAQHTVQTKAAHPLDMAQLSKGNIPFAPNPNAAAGPSAAHKTPARQPGMAGAAGKSAAKSATRSSPFGKQGDNISLPEIQTDDEDEDSDDDDRRGGGNGRLQVASWTNSPDLRRLLVGQETVDPMQIFGPPAPINMEEIFSKNKERFHKFRARTSSANWSGSDRLTEEDIRKDLMARDRMRREGGWSYELARDGLA